MLIALIIDPPAYSLALNNSIEYSMKSIEHSVVSLKSSFSVWPSRSILSPHNFAVCAFIYLHAPLAHHYRRLLTDLFMYMYWCSATNSTATCSRQDDTHAQVRYPFCYSLYNIYERVYITLHHYNRSDQQTTYGRLLAKHAIIHLSSIIPSSA